MSGVKMMTVSAEDGEQRSGTQGETNNAQKQG